MVRSPVASRWMSLAFAAVVISCVRDAPPAAPTAQLPSTVKWHYDVAVDEGARELRVEAAFHDGVPGSLVVGEGAEGFVKDVEVSSGRGEWRPLERAGTGWTGEACAGSCRVRYRFMLGDAAEQLADVNRAIAWGDAREAPPSTWLLHPELTSAGDRFRLRVRTAPGVSFATGLFPAGASDAFEAEAAYLPSAPYTAFGALASREVSVAGASILVARAPGELQVTDGEIDAWIAAAARSAAGVYGRFPLSRAMMLVVPVAGTSVKRGHALGDGGAAIVAEVGRGATAETLRRDWVLTHETIHLGFPSLARRHHWLEEGVAVYLQPIARARAGAISAEEAWRELALGMPRGLPHEGDRGLDGVTWWGRTYWGGALYCLLADVQIRLRTRGRFGFEDALRAIVDDGGNIAVQWPIERVLDTGDNAVGAPVLRELYARMGVRPGTADLGELWRALGVVIDGERVVLRDDTPLAPLRRAILK